MKKKLKNELKSYPKLYTCFRLVGWRAVSNPDLLVCSPEISGRYSLSTFEIAGRRWRYLGLNLEVHVANEYNPFIIVLMIC